MKMALNLLLLVFVFLAAADNAAAQIRRGIPPCSGRYGDCSYDRDPYYGYYGYGYGYGRPADPEAERIRRSGRAAKDQTKAYTDCLKESKRVLKQTPESEIADRCLASSKSPQPGTAGGADENISIIYRNLGRQTQASAKR